MNGQTNVLEEILASQIYDWTCYIYISLCDGWLPMKIEVCPCEEFSFSLFTSSFPSASAMIDAGTPPLRRSARALFLCACAPLRSSCALERPCASALILCASAPLRLCALPVRLSACAPVRSSCAHVCLCTHTVRLSRLFASAPVRSRA